MLRLARLAARPLERFLRIEAASAVLLVGAAITALACENSRLRAPFRALLHTQVGLRLGAWTFERSLEWVVNDVLMVVFFFVVGMEIRREIHHGELSTPRRAALPFAAALGGMLAPAAVFLLLAGHGGSRSGWGIPMATDIAFAVGAFAALGRRVPPALRVLLLALAVIDDLGAIVVIAVFYSGGIQASGLGIAALGVLSIFAMRAIGVRRKASYVLPSVVVWLGFYRSGLHPTLAGVVVGFITPVRAWLGPRGFRHTVSQAIETLSERARSTADDPALVAALRTVDSARREAISPSVSLIESLHPWVAFLIMPLFALANAGVSLEGASMQGEPLRTTLGVTVGLLLGKPLGVLVACTLALRLRLATLPVGIGFRQLVVLGVTAGIGFTMSLFTAHLAFRDATLLANAKVGVLAGSVSAAVLALALGRWLLPDTPTAGQAETADEAESSTEL
ncbi:MAG: Na+/H+ antiporter NhaA [Polyangiales bacterium]